MHALKSSDKSFSHRSRFFSDRIVGPFLSWMRPKACSSLSARVQPAAPLTVGSAEKHAKQTPQDIEFTQIFANTLRE